MKKVYVIIGIMFLISVVIVIVSLILNVWFDEIWINKLVNSGFILLLSSIFLSMIFGSDKKKEEIDKK